MTADLENLNGLSLTEAHLDGTDLSSATADQVTAVAVRLFETATGETVTQQRAYAWTDGEEYSGFIRTEEEVFQFTIEKDGDDWVLDVTEFDTYQQERDIEEVIYGADRKRPPALYSFLRAINERLNSGEDFGEAWNEVVFDEDGEDTELGDAIADWREQELIPRIGYEPVSDALDDCLERWALMDEFQG